MGEPGDEQHRRKRQTLPGRRWPRRFAWATAVVVVLAVAIAGVVIHAVRKDRLEVGAKRVGDVAVSGPGISSTAPFSVPNANLLVQASSGRSGSTDGGDNKIRAPRGGVLVRVVWSSIGAESPVPDHVESTPSSLAVAARGERVVVDRRVTPGTHEEQAVVALPGDVDDVVLEVRFAGRTQSVELRTGRRHTGAFAALYRGGAWPFGPNPALSTERKQPTDPRSPFEWSAEVKQGQEAYRLPYLKRLGWATKGREWLVVKNVAYYLNDDAARWQSGDRRVRYVVKGTPRLTVTVAGHGPVQVLAKPRDSVEHYGYSAPGDGVYVFSVRGGDEATVDTELRVNLRRSAGEGRAPARSTMVVTRSDVRPAVSQTEGFVS